MGVVFALSAPFVALKVIMQYFYKQPADRVLYDNWKKTTESWLCRWKYKKNLRNLYVPKGYVYDGASVPRFVWSLTGLRPDGEIRAASLAHDALYRSKGGTILKQLYGCKLTNGVGNITVCNRKEADWVFREFMKYATVSRRKRNMAYMAVRMFGKLFWGKEPPSGEIPQT